MMSGMIEMPKIMITRLDENVETVVVLKMKRMSAVEDGGYVWMALNEPSISLPATVAFTVSVVVEGCAPPLSTPSFAALKQ